MLLLMNSNQDELISADLAEVGCWLLLASVELLPRLAKFCFSDRLAFIIIISQSVLHTSKHGGRAHTHTHAAHDWLGSRHEARCHRP